jgi:aspartate/methionine/tyrosine aminotransferase
MAYLNENYLKLQAGYLFPEIARRVRLRSKIAQSDYRDRGIDMSADDEIFLSDGSKCDCGHILDILGEQNKIAITDPVYPVYVDTNVMAGHTGSARSRRRLRRHSLFARVHGGE